MPGSSPPTRSNLAVRAYALLAAAGRQALPLHEPDSARARPRLVSGSNRARTRGRGGHRPAEQLLAARPRSSRATPTTSRRAPGGLSVTWDGRDHRSRGRRCRSMPSPSSLERAPSTAASRGTLPARSPTRTAPSPAAQAALLGQVAAAGDADLFAAGLGIVCTSRTGTSAQLTSIRAELPPGARAPRCPAPVRPCSLGLGRTRLRDRIARAVSRTTSASARSCPEGSAVNVRLVDCPARPAYRGRAHLPAPSTSTARQS